MGQFVESMAPEKALSLLPDRPDPAVGDTHPDGAEVHP